MFTTLINWFANLWSTIKAIWQGAWDWLKYSWTWIIGVFYAVVAISDTVVRFVHDQITFVAEALGQMSTSDGDLVGHTIVGDIFEVGNTFFPLAETVSFVEAWSLMVLTALIYRLIKSWIPTVS